MSQEVVNRNPIASLERKRVRGFDAEREWIQERVPTTGAQVRLRKIMSSDTEAVFPSKTVGSQFSPSRNKWWCYRLKLNESSMYVSN